MNLTALSSSSPVEHVEATPPAQVEAQPQSLSQPDAPITTRPGRRSVISSLFSVGAPAVAAVAMALLVGFGAPSTAQAQGTTTASASCSQDAAWTAAMGSELGRSLTGDANGGRVFGALAGIIHRLSCTDTQTGAGPTPALSPELQQLNANLEQAFADPQAKYSSGSDLNDHQKQLLSFLADRVRRDPSLRLVILGHANDSAHAAFFNEGVAKERATKAAEFLATKGVAGARLETVGVSQGDGENRLQVAVVQGKAAQGTQPATDSGRGNGGLFGIPGLTINIGGGDRTNNPAVINRNNGTVNGGPAVNGRPNNNQARPAPGPGRTGWNGN